MPRRNGIGISANIPQPGRGGELKRQRRKQSPQQKAEPRTTRSLAYVGAWGLPPRRQCTKYHGG
eukprot:55345-Amphidinium_carterae.1